ncbi:hypothetical protein SLS53_004066 [Cytospora paraplurivora]|uniref:Uncharacterized protein n=1 Tax=Cytospora paraplurivora TaxID=2898453 RepID=A0AAN9UBB4_9PEZI
MAKDKPNKKLTMPAPYWGDLPGPTKVWAPPNIRDSFDDSRARQRLSSDTAPAIAPRSRSNRTIGQTTNTEPQADSTLGPYTLPTSSNYRTREQARPPSLPYGQSQIPPEVLEKRRRRASKNREEDYAYAAGATSPPAAPDVPRAPPMSFRHPYGNGGLPYTYQKEAPQQPDVPPSPGAMDPDYYQPLGAERTKRSNPIASPTSSGRVASDSAAALTRNGSSREPVSGNRKASLPNEEDVRLFADARSPLQKLELTLDSITKEEKRARIAAAEQRARERTFQASTDPDQQHAVRFNDKTIVTEPETSRPRILPDPIPAEPGVAPQRGAVVEQSAPQHASQPGIISTPTVPVSKFSQDNSLPQRNLSFRERAARNEIQIPKGSGPDDLLATPPMTTPARGYSVNRNGSDKLTKESPGESWYERGVEAEHAHRFIGQQRGTSRPPNEAPVMTAAAVPAGPTSPSKTAGGSVHSKAPPLAIAVEPRRPPGRSGKSADELDSPLTPGHGVQVPGYRKDSTAGQAPVPISIRSAPGSRQNVAETSAVNREAMPRTAAGTNTAAASAGMQQHDGNDSGKIGTSGDEHHVREYFHRHEYRPGHGMYKPPKYLDEWRKGTTGTLSGTMLDLGDGTTPSMDQTPQTWWGTSPSQRQDSNSRPRRAEAFDGEYEGTNGMYTPVDTAAVVENEGTQGHRESWAVHYDEVFPHARDIMGHQVTADKRKARR